MPEPKWTPELDTYITEKYLRTKMSFGDIARELNRDMRTNFTRNAVIGRVTRLKLTRRNPSNPVQPSLASCVSSIAEVKTARPPRNQHQRSISPTRLSPRLPPAPPPPPEEPTEPAPEGGVDLLELNDACCRWPLGPMHARPPYRFCGGAVVAGKSYCKEHAAKGVDHVRMGRTRRGASAS